jgi:hypothetical protein
MPNNDWWRGHAGPEKGKPLTWQRIEPGYYRLRGTDIYIVNMQGSSVMWSGMISDPWHVRIESGRGQLRARVATMAEAKVTALAWAKELAEKGEKP